MPGVTKELILQLKKLIIERLKLEEVSPEDIGTDDPLFGDGVIIPDAEVGQRVFQSVRTIAQYVVDNSGGG
jgi:acyl carrier protein